MTIARMWLGSVAILMGTVVLLQAADPVTLENLVAPQPNSADEPFAKEFSLGKAAHFLDSASLDWQQSWQCFTCHTNISYLIARPSISADAPAHREVRKYAEGPERESSRPVAGTISPFTSCGRAIPPRVLSRCGSTASRWCRAR